MRIKNGTRCQRFTCWHQFTQKRYTNEGIRIDYTLVDRSLMEYVEPLPASTPDDVGGTTMSLLRCGGRDASHPKNAYVDPLDPLGEEAALMAATACGLFESGSYAGGGIAPPTKRALDTQFIGVPHTGMVYTPPGYSDHIAVSLLMKDGLLSDRVGTLDLIDDAPTRKAQPHKRQRSISSFFSSGGTASTSSLSSSNGLAPRLATNIAGEKRTLSDREMPKTTTAPKKKSLHSFFGNPNNNSLGNVNGSALAGGTKSSSHKKPTVAPNNGLLKHFSKK